MAGNDNTIPIEAWNTVLFEKFSRFRHLLTHGLAGHSDTFFRENPYARGESVLDVGCGWGDTTLQIAQQVGPEGRAVGVDCASNFIDIAQVEARQRNVANAHYFTADVQGDDLRGPYDHA